MAFVNAFNPVPGPWLPFRDREVLDAVATEDFYKRQGRNFECPEFELKIVHDAHNYFVIDLFQRIRMAALRGERLRIILPSPENAVFISLSEVLNKYQVSAANTEVFFLYEYANEAGDVAPWQSPYSRSGHFMRYFYGRLEEHLRMPMEQIHFFTAKNALDYSRLLEDAGGADVAYTAMSWSGGLGAIDAETFPADSMEEFLAMGSGIVTPMMELIAHDSLRGMFGCSGDLANVPPRAATVGPRDIAAAKERFDIEYMCALGGQPAQQRFAAKLALFGPVCPKLPASMLRLFPGCCCVSDDVAKESFYAPDETWLDGAIEDIRRREEGR